MEMSHRVINKPLNQPQHLGNKVTKPPSTSSIGLIALGIILILGGAVAAGVLYPHLGYVSLSCLSAIPLGIVLIAAGVRRGNSSAALSTKKLEETTEDGTEKIHLETEKHKIENGILTIGAKEALDEQGITEQLKKFQGRRDINILIIYGNGNVALNKDPGFLELNPKKLILVGTHITHQPSNDNKLDDLLRRSGKWWADPCRQIDSTYVRQEKVKSIDEAIAHEPPQREGSNELYHVVYLVE